MYTWLNILPLVGHLLNVPPPRVGFQIEDQAFNTWAFGGKKIKIQSWLQETDAARWVTWQKDVCLIGPAVWLFTKYEPSPHHIPLPVLHTCWFYIANSKTQYGQQYLSRNRSQRAFSKSVADRAGNQLKGTSFLEAPSTARPRDALFLVTVRLILEASAFDMLPFSAH